MTAHLVGVLARRGIEAAHARVQRKDIDDIIREIPAWGLVLLIATFAFFAFAAASIEYTIRLVMAHLAMIETPETTVQVEVYTPLTMEEAKITQNLVDAGLIDGATLDDVVVTEKTKPITSSLRRTKRHIMSIGGCGARLRGLGIYLIYGALVGISSASLHIILRFVPLGFVLADVGAAVLASRLHCAWTHKVIAMPSAKSLAEQIASGSRWKELVLPTAISAGIHSLSVAIICELASNAALTADSLRDDDLSNGLAIIAGATAALSGAAALALALCVTLPAYVALVRKEASLLAPEEETIVPMDRTFGGKLSLESDRLKYVDAWKSVTSEVRRRLVKLYVKFFFVMVVFVFAASHVLAAEFFLVSGKGVKQVFQQLQERW